MGLENGCEHGRTYRLGGAVLYYFIFRTLNTVNARSGARRHPWSRPPPTVPGGRALMVPGRSKVCHRRPASSKRSQRTQRHALLPSGTASASAAVTQWVVRWAGGGAVSGERIQVNPAFSRHPVMPPNFESSTPRSPRSSRWPSAASAPKGQEAASTQHY